MNEGYQNYQDPRLQPPPEDPGEPGEGCIYLKWSNTEMYCIREVVWAAGDPQLLAKADVSIIDPYRDCRGCEHFDDERWHR